MTSRELRYTDDVKESLALARKLARRTSGGVLSDWQVLEGLLLTRRSFNRVDALLKELHTSPGRMRKQLETEVSSLNGKSKIIKVADDSGNHLLPAAEAMAIAEAGDTGKPPVVEVEHLLKALCQSEDPVVTRILAEQNITPERVDEAMQGVKRKKGRHSFMFVAKELVEVVAFVLFFLILIKSFLGELRLIPSESMVPLLQVEDRLVIERMTRWFRPYERGDVLVFYPPQTVLNRDPASVFLRLTGFSGLMYKKEDNIDVAFIKRLVGLPGDMVEVRPGEGVYVNGEKLDEPYINEVANTCTLMPWPQYPVHQEEICEPIRVPEGKYFFMGDNRNQSLDSRYWGFADKDRVIGRAVFRIWPPNRVGALPPAPYQAGE